MNLALTKAQQAPDQPSGCTPPCATVAQTERSAPVHCALMKAQSSNGGKIQATISRPMTVRTESAGVANRFLRTQAPVPFSPAGAAWASDHLGADVGKIVLLHLISPPGPSWR